MFLLMARASGVRLMDLTTQEYTQVYSGLRQTLAVGYDPVQDEVKAGLRNPSEGHQLHLLSL